MRLRLSLILALYAGIIQAHAAGGGGSAGGGGAQNAPASGAPPGEPGPLGAPNNPRRGARSTGTAPAKDGRSPKAIPRN